MNSLKVFLFSHSSSYWTAATLQQALLSKFPDIQQISQSTLRSRLKDTFWMSYKRIKRQHKETEKKERQRRFALGWIIQTTLNAQNYELMFLDEFSISDRSFKFFGWSKKGKSGFVRAIPDSFCMSFFVAFRVENFYGIMGTEGTGTSQKFIHFLAKVLKERRKMTLNEAKELVILLDNASIHKTKMVSKFVNDSKIRLITIPPYEPSLNPVEKFILAVKMKLRQKKQKGQ